MKKSGHRSIGLLGLLAIMLLSQVMFSGLVSNPGNTLISGNSFNQTNISTSAVNQNVQLAGAGQVVRVLSRNQSVRIANTSATSGLTLPAISAASSDLFSIQSDIRFNTTSFSTNDTIEKYSGFDYPYHSSGWLSTTATAASLITGNTHSTSDPKYLNFGTYSIPWLIDSVGNHVRVNISYAEPAGNISWPKAIRDDFKLSFSSTQTVSLSIFMYDNHNSHGWVNVTSTPLSGSSYRNPPLSGNSYSNQIFEVIDQHSQALYSNKYINVSYVFSASSNFQLSFYKALVQMYQAREIPINANSWVALSFDLRGRSTVHGFWMWIRSENLSSNENLIMTLFKTNNTGITYTQIISTTLYQTINYGRDAFYQQPGNRSGDKILSLPAIVNYNRDNLSYFTLPSPLSLPTGNYFLVLNSSKVSGTRYSLVTLAQDDDDLKPWFTFSSRAPDLKRVHTLAFSNNNGVRWNPVMNQSYYGSRFHEVNAAPFKVQLTRGLVPSDLNMTINGTMIKNWTMNPNLPYSVSNFEWGRGNWSQTNNLAIAATGSTIKTYKLGMTWNSTVMSNFIYNATAQLVAYANDPGVTICSISTNAPVWEVDYKFNRTKYANWTGFALNFTYPIDWVIYNMTYPDKNNHYSSSRIWKLNSYQMYYGINESMINTISPSSDQQGVYKAMFTSPNYLKSVTTYLRCNSTTYYPVSQYSSGDAMTARVGVQSKTGKPVFNGAVNITLFSPANNAINSTRSNVINSTAGFVTSYHFNDTTVHVFRSSDPIGQYMARTFWFNGSEVGNAYPYIYNVNYTVSEYHAEVMLDTGVDLLYGHFSTGANQAIPTNIAQVAIDTSQKAALNVSVNQTIGELFFESFNQSETAFNPGDMIHFSVKIESDSWMFQHTVEVQVQVIQAFQPDRIIMNANSKSVLMNYTGGINSTQTITVNARCPTGNSGVNAPFRHALLETQVQFIVDGQLATTWLSNKTFAVKMDNKAINGTVLSVVVKSDETGSLFSQAFNRVNQTVFDKPTTFMLLLESSDGVTLSKNLFVTLTNVMQSKITNITVAPITGDVFAINNKITINGNLSLENGSSFMKATNIVVMKNSSNTWIPYNSAIGNNILPVVNGSFTGTFSLPQVYSKNFSVSLNWSGNLPLINKTSTIFVINLTYYNATAKIISLSPAINVYGEYKNFFTFVVQNTGNTTLMFDSYINITGVSWRNATWTNDGILDLAPNSTFSFTVVLVTNEPGFGNNPPVNITITLHAYSIETNTTINVTQTFLAHRTSLDILSRLGAIWYVGYFAIIVILALLAIVLIVRVVRQSRMPAGPGALAKGKIPGKEGEKPYIVKKGAELGKGSSSKEKGTEKKYRPIEDVMKEIKGDAGSKADASSRNEKDANTREKPTEDEDPEA